MGCGKHWQVAMLVHLSLGVWLVKLKEDAGPVERNDTTQLDRLPVEVVGVLATVVQSFEELLLREDFWAAKWETVCRSVGLRVWQGDYPSTLSCSWNLVLRPVVHHSQWLLRSLDPQTPVLRQRRLHAAVVRVSVTGVQLGA